VPDPIYPAITEPTEDLASLTKTVQQLKEAVELLTGQRDQNYAYWNPIRKVEKTVGFVNAKFTEEIKVTNNGITALSSHVTTVEATANQASAFGQVTLKATAAPGGASAAYGWYITAGDKYAGMLAGVDSTTGGAFIAFSAESLRFTNSGTHQPVFEYDNSANVFRFFVPVEVLHDDIADHAITNSASNAGSIATGSDLSVTLGGIRAGARVEVECAVTDTTASVHAASTTIVQRLFPFSVDSGGALGYVTSLDNICAASVTGGSPPYWSFFSAITPATGLFLVTGLTAGSHTFSVVNGSGYTVGMTIKVRELAR
jgi:hypothetical protein